MKINLNKKEIKLIIEALDYCQYKVESSHAEKYANYYDLYGDLINKIENQCGNKYLGYNNIEEQKK